MSHYAKVENGVVVNVVVAEADWVAEQDGQWVQTSYNTRAGVHYGPDGQPDGGVALRMNYAMIGGLYDATLDAFIPARPYPSWTLDTSTCTWVPPVARPEDGNFYLWNETSKSWVLQPPRPHNP